MRHLSFLFIVLFSAAAQAGESPLVPFYRTQKSLFPSGQISRSILENAVLRQEQRPWYRVRWNKKDFELPGEIVLKDVQVTQTLQTSGSLALLKSPQAGSLKTTTVPAQTNLIVLKTDESWAQVLEPKKKISGWAPLTELTAPSEDKGVFVTLLETFLRKNATGPGDVLALVPRHQRLVALGIEKSFLKVRYQGKIGYVDLSAVVGRADFAMWAYHRTRGWLGISHRENGVLITVNDQKFPLDDFIAYSPYVTRGVISNKFEEGAPSIRSRVEITDSTPHLWNLSLLDGHGQVWWRYNQKENPAASTNSEVITTEVLLKRDVRSFAFASSKSMKGLASAGGIYKTTDGKTWTEIPQFAGQNFPVSIHPEGVWFVGSYRSFDEGKTFEPYIKWDRLAEQIQSSIHKAPRHLRIATIEPLSHSRVRISVDTGVQVLKMQAHFLSHEWQITK